MSDDILEDNARWYPRGQCQMIPWRTMPDDTLEDNDRWYPGGQCQMISWRRMSDDTLEDNVRWYPGGQCQLIFQSTLRNVRLHSTYTVSQKISTEKSSLSWLEQLQTEYVWFLCRPYPTVASALCVTGSVFMRRFRLFLDQCSYFCTVPTEF